MKKKLFSLLLSKKSFFVHNKIELSRSSYVKKEKKDERRFRRFRREGFERREEKEKEEEEKLRKGRRWCCHHHRFWFSPRPSLP